MVSRVKVQAKIQKGRGKAAQKIGVPYDVYRVGPAAAGDFLDVPNRINQNVFAIVRRLNTRNVQTPLRSRIYWLELISNLTTFRVGDLFINVDPVFNLGKTQVDYLTSQLDGFVIANDQTVGRAIGVLINDQVSIFRCDDTADPSGNWSPDRTNALPVTLAAGAFAFGALADTPALIPCQLFPEVPSGDRAFDDVPSMIRRSTWSCYIPPLPPGFSIREGDRIIRQTGERYIVMMVHNQEQLTSGSQLVLEREVAQP